MGSLFSTTFILDFRYFLTIFDDHSRYLWVILIKTKGKVPNCLKGFINMVKTQFEKNVKTIRGENGSEFLLKAFYEEHVIMHQRKCVSTP